MALLKLKDLIQEFLAGFTEFFFRVAQIYSSLSYQSIIIWFSSECLDCATSVEVMICSNKSVL